MLFRIFTFALIVILPRALYGKMDAHSTHRWQAPSSDKYYNAHVVFPEEAKPVFRNLKRLLVDFQFRTNGFHPPQHRLPLSKQILEDYSYNRKNLLNRFLTAFGGVQCFTTKQDFDIDVLNASNARKAKYVLRIDASVSRNATTQKMQYSVLAYIYSYKQIRSQGKLQRKRIISWKSFDCQGVNREINYGAEETGQKGLYPSMHWLLEEITLELLRANPSLLKKYNRWMEYPGHIQSRHRERFLK